MLLCWVSLRICTLVLCPVGFKCCTSAWSARGVEETRDTAPAASAVTAALYYAALCDCHILNWHFSVCCPFDRLKPGCGCATGSWELSTPAILRKQAKPVYLPWYDML
jgi:hypothetical protein